MKARASAGRKNGSFFPQGREPRRPSRAEVLLEARVQGDVARVVEEEIELDLVVDAPAEEHRVERVRLGRDAARIAIEAQHRLGAPKA
jgi:hypothetical protein